MSNSDNYLIVIRSVGERTHNILFDLLCKQTHRDNIITVNETPFELALYRTYEFGISSNKEWLFTLDADVIPFHDTVKSMQRVASKLPDQCFHAECKVFDKLKNEWRKAGNRVYRVSSLSQLRSLLPENGMQVRPESYTINEMIKKGHESAEFWLPVGIHDFEQYHSDLYRKAYAYSGKFKHQISDIKNSWEQLSDKDDDFKICLEGLKDAIKENEHVEINKLLYEERAIKALARLGLKEKNELSDPQTVIEQTELIRKSMLLEEKPWVMYRHNGSYIPDKRDKSSMIERVLKKLRG